MDSSFTSSAKDRIFRLVWNVARSLPSALGKRLRRRLEGVRLRRKVAAGYWLTIPYRERACWQTDYEKKLFEWLKQNLRTGDYCIDANAHAGCFALFLGRIVGPEGHVSAIEPLPENQELLKLNVADNGLDEVIEIHEACCAAREGGSWLNLEPPDHLPPHRYDRLSFPMPALSLDGLSLKLGRLDMALLDLGGAELEALEGATTALRKFKPKLVLRLYPPFAAEAPIFLAAQAYRPFHLSGKQWWMGDLVLRAGNPEEPPFYVVFLPEKH